MPQPKPKKVVYLFGAGATQSELDNSYPTLKEKGLGLLIGDVSRRVMERASRVKAYLKDVEMVSATSGSLNIELLISLLENSKIHGCEAKTQLLKGFVQKDIEAILSASRTKSFYLHKALLELHKHKGKKREEELLGLVSLNYDDVLDQAYEQFYGEPNYCFSLEQNTALSKRVPLLKLHGSFNWSSQEIRGRERAIEIIPLGSNKTYLHAPYGFIWNRAMEVLIECDILRVIGCSLSQNDLHLIDLLFKAHLERSEAFEIEIIGPQPTGDQIKQNYGFFPKIKTLREIEGHLIPDPDPTNAFKTWLKYKVKDMIRKDLKRTQYLKTVIV
jgi:hypothetical protein